MHVPYNSPFFLRLFLIHEGTTAIGTAHTVPKPFDLLTDCMLVTVPGEITPDVQKRARLDGRFRSCPSVVEVQWIGDEAAILRRTVALCVGPRDNRTDDRPVIYGPFFDRASAEQWMNGAFPTTAHNGHVLYPIPNAFSLCLHTWRAEMHGVLGHRVREEACRFGDPKQRLVGASSQGLGDGASAATTGTRKPLQEP